MKLEWVIHQGMDDGEKFVNHLLVDAESQRILGDVAEPEWPRISLLAEPDEGKPRRYLTLEAAKQYVEFAAVRMDQRDYIELEDELLKEPKADESKSKAAD